MGLQLVDGVARPVIIDGGDQAGIVRGVHASGTLA